MKDPTDADYTLDPTTTSGAATSGATHGTMPDGEAMREEDRAPMGLSIRVFIYLVGVHFIAAFLFLLFYLAGAK
ncbi:DUF6126 family protein [Streptomyces sp. ME19-01-6]|uniref:DUF6126 family protein n=1 Tax=Streptomyces sp. ME19-01-6 TaxID=3028686 RepID=UPI0029B4C6B5|nr:DUF6126 family protein [Streptomyces sp. ME19-01-6]MDX3229992.1 DUF6126 family protein [Streptomyces sp. ME19-01-6]